VFGEEDVEQLLQARQGLLQALEQVCQGNAAAAADHASAQALDLLGALGQQYLDMCQVAGWRAGLVQCLHLLGDALGDFPLQGDECRVALYQAGLQAHEVAVQLLGSHPDGQHFQGVQAFGTRMAAQAGQRLRAEGAAQCLEQRSPAAAAEGLQPVQIAGSGQQQA